MLIKKIPERKSSEEIDNSSRKILFKDITGIDGDLNLITTFEEESQTETIDLNEHNFYSDDNPMLVIR